jgi:hypothetical protein
LNPRSCTCSAYETAAVMAGKHRLYARQREMLAGGPPIDPALALAATYWRPVTDDDAKFFDELAAEYLVELAKYHAEQLAEVLRKQLPPIIL